MRTNQLHMYRTQQQAPRQTIGSNHPQDYSIGPSHVAWCRRHRSAAWVYELLAVDSAWVMYAGIAVMSLMTEIWIDQHKCGHKVTHDLPC